MPDWPEESIELRFGNALPARCESSPPGPWLTASCYQLSLFSILEWRRTASTAKVELGLDSGVCGRESDVRSGLLLENGESATSPHGSLCLAETVAWLDVSKILVNRSE